jgi:hypothetical protein
MARIAMFIPRSPRPPMTGRKAGIHAAVAALAEDDHEVDLLVLANKDAMPAPEGAKAAHGGAVRRVVWLSMPGKLLALRNAAASMLAGRYSLNEAFFRSERLLACARGLRRDYDFAVADTIRAAPYAEALGVPWHLDLDDLYSTRYEKYLAQPRAASAGELLGYYRRHLPRVASALPQMVVRRVLKREVARLEERELYWAQRATSLSLASPDEAQRLATHCGRRVHCALMSSVRMPALRWQADKARPGTMVFVGGLEYKPNLDALHYYERAVFPLIRQYDGAAPPLSHIGSSPEGLCSTFSSDAVTFEGYVPDLFERLVQASVFVAPLVSGTGIKTKVLEAMALGMPLLATREAVSGLTLEHKRHCFLCDRPADFVDGLRHFSDPAAARNAGINARRYVEEHFSIDVLRQRWRSVIAELTASSAVP